MVSASGLPAANASGVSQAALEIWNDPSFQRQFAESYMSDSDVEPRVNLDERESMQKVLDYISSEKMDKAESMLEKKRGEKSNALYDFMLANILFQQEKLEAAAPVYETAVEKFPKFRRAWRNLGIIYVRQGEFEKAVPALSKVIELGGGDAITYGLLGFAYSSIDNHLSAESAFRMAILLDPVTKDWKMGLARSLFKQSRYAEAVALCNTLIEKDPDNADLWLLQANAFIGLKKPMKAAENYELVDRLGKSTPESLTMLADIYINAELYDMGVDSYIRAMEKSPDARPDRVLRAAKVLTVRGALADCRRLIERTETILGSRLNDEDRKAFLKLRARLAVAEGAGDEEAHILEQIVEIDPLDGEALILLGQHAGRNGDTEKAVFYYERSASLEKFEADAKVRHGQLLVGQGKYKEALPLLRRAQTINPRDDVQKYLDQVEQIAKTR